MTTNIEFRAFQGTDSVFLAWWSPSRLDGCLGYAVQRRVNGGAPTPLQAYVGFPNGKQVQPNPAGQPSTVWPYQRFTWTDFEPLQDAKVQYQVVAIVGSAKSPQESNVASEWVTPDSPETKTYRAFFNRGIVASRWLAKVAEEYPDKFSALKKALSPTHGNSEEAADQATASAALEDILRLPLVKGATPTIGDELGGELSKQVMTLLAQAVKDKSTEVYLALFELSDSQVIDLLGKLGPRCHLILANGTHEHGSDENADAAKKLAGTTVDLSRRMLHPAGVYAHNKFAVFVKNREPYQVLTGSTNLTPHGLYTQVNNGLLVDDPGIAQAYLEEWNRLKAAGDETPPPQHPPAQEQYHFDREGVSTSVFFSPHRLPKTDGANSPDLKYASSLIRGARQGILTLMLDPGWQGSLLQDIREQAEKDPSLYIRGVVNTDPTVHSKSDDPTAVGFLHGTEAVPSNYDIVLPSAQREADLPIIDYLSRVGIVVVHSKIIVIDPLGSHPVVMTGSHNEGVKAATINDDNLIIIENNPELALAYAINVISTFNHFWWRHNMAPPSKRKTIKANSSTIGGPANLTSAKEWTGLNPTDSWQNKFYATGGDASEARFWGLST